MQKIVDQLQVELARLRAYIKVLEAALGEAGLPLPGKPKGAAVLAAVSALASAGEGGVEAGLLRAKLGESAAQCELLEV